MQALKVTSLVVAIGLVVLVTLLWVVPSEYEVTLLGRIAGSLVGLLFVYKFGLVAIHERGGRL